MKIGVPKEIKSQEARVGLTPGSVKTLISQGHQVFVETQAGQLAGFWDAEYQQAGATLLETAEAVFQTSELIIKVKEPQPEECKRLAPGQILFTYLHLAAHPKQADLLLKSKAAALGYETVTDDQHRLPLLAPMSEIAGRLAVQAGAHCLELPQGGRGILLGGIQGAKPAEVLILGGGNAGRQAAWVALGMGATVTVLDNAPQSLEALSVLFKETLNTSPQRLSLALSTSERVHQKLIQADLVISAVLIPGAQAPKLITRALLQKMKKGAVIVDLAIDQGGSLETSHETTYRHPTYIEEGIVHYCVGNMPAGVPHTATVALNHVTLPFILAVANEGLIEACQNNVHLCRGLNLYQGQVTHPAVAEALGKPYYLPQNIFRK